ncbi:MAG: VWA domain-containing protein [Spirochaetota bacterium]
MFMLDRPWALLFLALIPVWILLRRSRTLGFRLFLSLSDSRGEAAPLPHPVWRGMDKMREACSLAGFAVLAFALAGPALVSQSLLFLERGNEIIMAIDVSPSMAAADFQPSRLGAASALVKGLLASRRNEAVGLVAFGSEAALLCPPTLDHAMVARRLGELKPGMLGEGTALGTGIAVAAAHGGAALAERKRHIIVLTDGESNAGTIAPGSAADLAFEAGFSVSVVGIGSKGQVPLSYADPGTGTTRSGTLASGFDAQGLAAIARRGGGSYYDASDSKGLAAAFDSVAEQSLSLSRTRSVSSERSMVPLFSLIAFVLIALSRLLGLIVGVELP